MTLDTKILTEIEQLIMDYNNLKQQQIPEGHNVRELHELKLRDTHIENYEKIKAFCAVNNYNPLPYIQIYYDRMNVIFN